MHLYFFRRTLIHSHTLKRPGVTIVQPTVQLSSPVNGHFSRSNEGCASAALSPSTAIFILLAQGLNEQPSRHEPASLFLCTALKKNCFHSPHTVHRNCICCDLGSSFMFSVLRRGKREFSEICQHEKFIQGCTCSLELFFQLCM